MLIHVSMLRYSGNLSRLTKMKPFFLKAWRWLEQLIHFPELSLPGESTWLMLCLEWGGQSPCWTMWTESLTTEILPPGGKILVDSFLYQTASIYFFFQNKITLTDWFCWQNDVTYSLPVWTFVMISMLRVSLSTLSQWKWKWKGANRY